MKPFLLGWPIIVCKKIAKIYWKMMKKGENERKQRLNKALIMNTIE